MGNIKLVVESWVTYEFPSLVDALSVVQILALDGYAFKYEPQETVDGVRIPWKISVFDRDEEAVDAIVKDYQD